MFPIQITQIGLLISLLALISAVQVYKYQTSSLVSSNGSTINIGSCSLQQLEGIWNPICPKEAPFVSTENDKDKEPLNIFEETTKCSLEKVNGPPTMQLLLHFPIFNECREVSIPEKIGTDFKLFGTFLLDDDDGHKVNNILHNQQDRTYFSKEVNRKILQEWLNGYGDKSITWATLIDVLDRCRLVLAEDIRESIESSFMGIPPQLYPYDYVTRLAAEARDSYSSKDPIDPTQNLLENLGNIKLPFVPPKLSNDKQFDDVLEEIEVGNRLLITGRPGVGKSTLMRYAAKMWGNKTLLSHCQLLIHVPLSTTLDTLDTLIMKTFYSAEDEQLVVKEIKKSKGEGVCFLLDSFDEYHQHTDKGMDFVLNLLEIGSDHQVLPQSTVIMTSRPEAVTSIRKYFELEMEISGIQSKHVKSYIKELPSPLNETIKTSLEKNPHVELMCYTPLHLTMMVRLACVDVNKLSSLTTETSLYIQFLFLTVKQFKPRRLTWTTSTMKECFTDKLSHSEICQLFRTISKLAYDALSIGEQSFNSTLLPKDYHDKAETLSLFTIETRTSSLDNDNVYVYYFSHRTFQEFIVACHLYMLPQEDQTNEVYLSLDWHRYRLKSNLLWKFFFGLLGKYDVKSLETNFKHLSYGRRHCCNMSNAILDDIVIEIAVDCNMKLLEYAYEAGMEGSLFKIVNEMKAIVGPVFSDDLHLTLRKPKDCLIMDYALQIIPVRRLVLIVTGELDCVSASLSRNEEKRNYSEVLLEELELTTPFESSEPNSLSEGTMITILTVVPTIHLRQVTLNFDLGDNLQLLLQSLNPETVHNLVIKTSTLFFNVNVDMVKLSMNLKLLTNLESFEMDIKLNSSGILEFCDALPSMHKLQRLELSVVDMNITASNKLAKTLAGLYQLRSLSIAALNERLTADFIPKWSRDKIFWDVVLLDILSHLTLLEDLKLSLNGDFENYCNCTMLIAGLFNMKHLRKLELDFDRICFKSEDNNELVDTPVQSTELSHLSIWGNLIQSPASKFISNRLPAFSQLKYLRMTVTQNSLPIIIDDFRNLTKLETLVLVRYSDLAGEHLATMLANLKSLKYLDLSHFQHENQYLSPKFYRSLSNLPLLVELDLGGNDLKSTGAVDALAVSLSNLTKLTNLDLGLTLIGDDELKALTGSLKYLTELTSLDLCCNTIRANGLVALSGILPHLKKLEYLDLSGNEIDGQGALALVESLPYLPKLEYLKLSWNQIGDKGILAIADSLLNNATGLVYLDLSNNEVSEESVRKVRKRLKYLPEQFQAKQNRLPIFHV